MKYNKPQMPQVRDDVIIFSGGVNQAEAQLELKKGELVDAINYMEVDGSAKGYVSLKGYERIDSVGITPSDTTLVALKDEGINNTTSFLLESDGLLTFTDQINDAVLTSYSVTEPSVALYPYSTTSFLVAGTGGLVLPNASAPDLAGQKFSLDFKFKAHASISPLADTYLVKYGPSFSIYWKNVGPYAFLTVSVTGASLVTTEIITQTRLEAGKEYHICLACKEGVGAFKARVLVNGAVSYNASTIQPLLFDLVEGLTPLGASDVYFGASNPATSAQSTYGYFDSLRIEEGTYKFYSSYEMPYLRYSNTAYFAVQYDDEDREAAREAVVFPGSINTTPNGVFLFSGDNCVYTKKGYVTQKIVKTTKYYLYKSSTNTLATGNLWTTIPDVEFNAGGKFSAVEFRVDGYGGNTLKMILFDGVSYPYIWDGTTATKLDDPVAQAGISEYAVTHSLYPDFAIVWANRLVFGYKSGHLLMSANFDPTDFSANGFGIEASVGDTITNLVEGPDNTLIVFMRNSIKVFYSQGDGTGTFEFTTKVFSRTDGALEGTVQRAPTDIIYMDDRGLMAFQTTDKFGSFVANSLSKKVNRTLLAKKNTITCSYIDKEANQYRLFFSDKTGIIFTFNSEGLLGATFVKYDRVVRSVTSGEDSNGNIVTYFVSDNSPYVYKMNSGESFDGAEYYRFIETGYYSFGYPRMNKRFRKLTLEIDVDEDFLLEFDIQFNFDYRSRFLSLTELDSVKVPGNPNLWGAGNWGSFTWTPKYLVERPSINFSGYGTNMSTRLYHSSKYTKQHTLHNAIIDFTLNNKRKM